MVDLWSGRGREVACLSFKEFISISRKTASPIENSNVTKLWITKRSTSPVLTTFSHNIKI